MPCERISDAQRQRYPAALAEQARILRRGQGLICLEPPRPRSGWMRPLLRFTCTS